MMFKDFWIVCFIKFRKFISYQSADSNWTIHGTVFVESTLVQQKAPCFSIFKWDMADSFVLDELNLCTILSQLISSEFNQKFEWVIEHITYANDAKCKIFTITAVNYLAKAVS